MQFLDSKTIACAGYDKVPHIFTLKGDTWEFSKSYEGEKPIGPSKGSKNSRVDMMKKSYSKSKTMM